MRGRVTAVMAVSRMASAASLHAHARIIVAGTFDRLHEGHYSLLHTGFAHGAHVEIWVRSRF